MGKSRRIKTKRLADEILTLYPTSFTRVFQENKHIIADIIPLQSKTMRNQIAGYITRLMNKKQAREYTLTGSHVQR